jgi:proteasome alpha subunit
MIEEPYRWVEAIATRRDYIEMQLATGSPVVALGYAEGVLLFTVGQQKLFEIYDRIALGAIGHPGDIERLRMAAIELASTEGFTRSAADVSLRRLAYYSLSPVMKNAFEQIYGAPFLARLLFVEIGPTLADDLFLEIEYDGAINLHSTNGGNTPFAVLAATKKSAEQMADFLGKEFRDGRSLAETLELALDTWTVGQVKPDEQMPVADEIRQQRKGRLGSGTISAAVLERNANVAVRYRSVETSELAPLNAK